MVFPNVFKPERLNVCAVFLSETCHAVKQDHCCFNTTFFLSTLTVLIPIKKRVSIPINISGSDSMIDAVRLSLGFSEN